jgi:hypothetical protein
VGAKLLDEAQRADVEYAIGHVPNYGLLDLVAAWYVKAVDYIQDTHIQAAFVSTNSISQGEQVGVLWSYLLSRGAKINFAHRTFKWMNEAKGVAAVFCVIIGFDLHGRSDKTIHDYPDIKGEAVGRPARNINPYLVDSKDVIIPNRNEPICDVPRMGIGNKPIDGGNYLFTTIERDAFIQAEPQAAEFFSKWLGSDEFINGWNRWVLWLGTCPPQKLKSMPKCLERVEAVRTLRLASKSAPTRNIADTPTRFHVEKFPSSTFIVVPKVSSERRPFLPIGFMSPDVICSDLLQLVPDATLFHFGIIQSTMHMSWMRQVCGRLKSDYRYSNSLVYNNFPWPKCTPPSAPCLRASVATIPSTSSSPCLCAQNDVSPHVQAVEKAAQSVLDARALFPDASLADLYDPLTMPPALSKAHKALDVAVDACYRSKGFGTELERVEFLFGLYEEYTAALTAGAGKKGKKG